ncbi:hypothetical protein [Litoribacter populi]|uniref:hypothetical protein n=1 Tax=Litoribacter populi TaxID=2598460 RepID=UPI0011814EF8|nr:hypothetical protein [Litoribacter populi]
MNSSQFLSLIEKGNELERDDLHHLIKLHQSFPYFQIPMVLAAKIEYARDSKNEEFLHWAAALSPDRIWLKKILEQEIDFTKVYAEPKDQATLEPTDNVESEIISPDEAKLESTDKPEIVENPEGTENDQEKPDLIASPEEADKDTPKPTLIVKEDERAEISEPEIVENSDIKLESAKEEDKNIIEPLPGPPSNRMDILRQLEENLSKLKKEPQLENQAASDKKEENEEAKPKAQKKPIKRKRRGTDEILESIKKKEKKEIKDSKKLEQSDIIKEFSKKSIKMAAIRENEDVNRLEDLSTRSTQVNDRLVSESYAKLLTQQGKAAAAKEIYQKLILKFPQKKAYFADLMKKLED